VSDKFAGSKFLEDEHEDEDEDERWQIKFRAGFELAKLRILIPKSRRLLSL
jgi:hypothetical protein